MWDSMLAVERRKRIIEMITQKKSVLVQELSRQFEVTEETVRRDLEKLEQQGILVRTYGGATLVGESVEEVSVEVRQSINIIGKDLIGMAAAELIEEGETIFLDASTSSLSVAKYIKNRKGITVITNAEKVVVELSNSESINVICVGGILRKTSMSYVGRVTETTILNNFYANKTFFSCRGVTLNRGLTDSNEQEAEVKKAMLQCSDQVIFLCDHSKLGKLGVPILAPLEQVDHLVTDKPLDDEWQNALANLNISVTVANGL